MSLDRAFHSMKKYLTKNTSSSDSSMMGDEKDTSTEIEANTNTNHAICIVLASDGVWDNWQYKGIALMVYAAL